MDNRERCKLYYRTHKEKYKAYQKAHKEEIEKRILRRRQFNRALLRFLKEAPCMDCHQQFPSCVMDFDHKKGENKKRGVAQMVRNASTRAFFAEIKKCELVCANCHRIRTAQRRKEKKNETEA